MAENHDDAKKSVRKVGGLLFVGCMFIGMAAGFYFKAMPMGLFGGMGIGFIMMAGDHVRFKEAIDTNNECQRILRMNTLWICYIRNH